MHDHLRGPLSPILSTKTNLSEGVNFRMFRTELRTKLIADKLADDSTDLTFELNFEGSGDSGNWDDTLEDPLIQHMFDYVLETFVDWDWYNNKGGGGTITWNVVNDEIEINGYWNDVLQVAAEGCVLSGQDTEETETA